MTGDGEATVDAAAREATRLALHAQTGDLGELLGRMATAVLPVVAVSGARYPWPGGSDAFDLVRARGSIDIDLGEDLLLTLDPGDGRMLGAFHIDTLQWRLKLDFSGLVCAGSDAERVENRAPGCRGCASRGAACGDAETC